MFCIYGLKPDKNLHCFCSEECVQVSYYINYYHSFKDGGVLGIGFIFDNHTYAGEKMQISEYIAIRELAVGR